LRHWAAHVNGKIKIAIYIQTPNVSRVGNFIRMTLKIADHQLRTASNMAGKADLPLDALESIRSSQAHVCQAVVVANPS